MTPIQKRGIWYCEEMKNGDLLSVRINQDQLQSKKHGTKENPVPIFAIDLSKSARWFLKKSV
ncbi:hypothetical protein ASG31_11470 [Chryseobacterium sp. Leaf404]|nr:hypothetical protein ASG31_11470 [Chryseobacterium sp. Leaf404]